MSVLHEVKSYKGASARGSQTDTLTSITIASSERFVALWQCDEISTQADKSSTSGDGFVQASARTKSCRSKVCPRYDHRRKTR
jgi:hypothetical protein